MSTTDTADVDDLLVPRPGKDPVEEVAKAIFKMKRADWQNAAPTTKAEFRQVARVACATAAPYFVERWRRVASLPEADGFYECYSSETSGRPPGSHWLHVVEFRDGAWRTSWRHSHWRPLPHKPGPGGQR